MRHDIEFCKKTKCQHLVVCNKDLVFCDMICGNACEGPLRCECENFKPYDCPYEMEKLLEKQC